MAVSYEEYQRAQSDVMLYEQRVTGYQIKVLGIQKDLELWESLPQGSATKTQAILTKIQAALTRSTENLNEANSQLLTARTTVSTFENSPPPVVPATETIKTPLATNPSASDEASANKVATAGIVGDTTQPSTVPFRYEIRGVGSNPDPNAGELGNQTPSTRIPPGAQPPKRPPATVNVNSARGATAGPDLRVKLRVPDEYLISNSDMSSSALYALGGIIFPYTPSITFNQTATYTQQNPTHSNYSINFYKNSSVSNITITGDFTVQNEKDARIYLATIHLLRALTKMQFGTDSNAGAPPPVCRLDAYGMYMLSNVPVAISDFRNDLPNTVDYYAFGKGTGSLTSVPVKSTIAITCIPMYSRAEMQKFSVDGWLKQPSEFRNMGYL